MTLKKAILRGLIGIPIGVFISQAILLVISLGWGNGSYLTAMPDFIKFTGSELNAIALQFLMSCMIGFVFAAASAIYEVDSWGITKQTILHLVVLCTVFFPIALFLRWVSLTFASIGLYFLIWIVIYAAIWAIEFSVWKGKTSKLNKKLGNK